jgi:uncharacterized protein YqeY
MLQCNLVEIMADLKQQLQADVAEAMRSGDVQKRNVLRLLLAAIKQAEVDGRQTLDEEGVQAVLRKEIKQRQESIADYEKAGRSADVEQLQIEKHLIESYLPQMLSREEIEAMASAVIADLGVTDPKGIGQVMSRLMPQLKDRADGRLVNEVVRDLLK